VTDLSSRPERTRISSFALLAGAPMRSHKKARSAGAKAHSVEMKRFRWTKVQLPLLKQGASTKPGVERSAAFAGSHADCRPGYFQPSLRDWNHGERSAHEHSNARREAGRTLQETESFPSRLSPILAGLRTGKLAAFRKFWIYPPSLKCTNSSGTTEVVP
jgi:hypothetical protein